MPVRRPTSLSFALLFVTAGAGCIGHRFSPATSPLASPQATFDSQDYAAEVIVPTDGPAALGISLLAKPGRLLRAGPDATAATAAASAERASDASLDDVYLALDCVNALVTPGDADPIGALGLRVGYQSRWFAGDVGLQFTMFTFVVGASVGPRFDLQLNERVAVRGQLDLHGGVPLDPELGYRGNRGLFGATSGVTPAATAGARAHLGLGVGVVHGLELRVSVMARAMLDDRGASQHDVMFAIGLGADL